ncbi:hypothetical protein F5Y13DRAFT_204660 [Hypoxylon sp. FL1857]|nr:hypothetical protein F5Y13DRAFT_204660 [Hypoxylon sp. FL1857]
MCLEVYIHHTSRENDSRQPCIVNPATGYKVLSPFQEPYPCRPCAYTHVTEPIPPQQSCPYHPSCCKLEGKVVCRFEDGACTTRVKYHHFAHKEDGEVEDLSFLDAYLVDSPPLLFLVAWFFKTGSELAIAQIHRDQISARLSRVGGSDSNEGNAAERAALEVQLAHFSYIVAYSGAALAQFAILWDLNSSPGALPPRPGWNPDPEQNATLSRKLKLTVQGWDWRDTGRHSWPPHVELWEEFRTGSLPVYEDPSIMTLQEAFTPLSSSSSLNLTHISPQRQPISFVSFNTGVPIMAPDRRAPTEARSSPVSPPSPPSSPNDYNPGSNTNSDNADSASDRNRMYYVEDLVDHRPRTSTLRQVKQFKVRWAGNWPPDQKETWQPRRDIPSHIIAGYWGKISDTNHRRANMRRRRRMRQQKGEY